MPSTHASPQVCRPHFHTPLSPWLTSEHKSFAPASAWSMGQFACPQEPQVEHKLGQMGQSHQTTAAGQHSFPFPPTPPKDSTPDSVQTGPSEYQVSGTDILSIRLAAQSSDRRLFRLQKLLNGNTADMHELY